MTEQEKVQRDRVIEAVFPVIADRMGWHHRIDEHPPRNTNFACDVADAAIAAMQPTPQEPRCAKCGHPKSNHPYRHPFVSIAQDAAMDRLVSEGQRCDAMTPQEAAKVLLAAVDAFMSGEKLTEEQRELERTAVIAGAFAGGAYDRYWPKGGGEYHALTRVFLLALIDPDHAELDYLRTDPSAGQTARDARAALRAISEDSHE